MGKVKEKAGADQVEKRPVTATNEKVTKEEIQLATDTLVGDLRDAQLDRIKALKKPWEKMNESEQRQLVESITNSSLHLVKGTVDLIAKNGRNTINATLDSFTVKDGLKAVIKAPMTEEALLQLGQAQGHPILLVAAPTAQYEGERKAAQIDPDQGDFERRMGATGASEKAA